MKPVVLFACAAFFVASSPRAARAQTWCQTEWPSAVFCEDFDGYPDGMAFYNAWTPTGDVTGFCGSPLGLDTDYASSPPLSAKMNTQEHGDFGYSVNGISDSIRVALGPEYSSVIGTDLNPLVLELVMNGQSNAKAPFDNTFLTLAYGSAFAPTDWAWSDWCGCMPPPLKRWPVICQQESPAAACPPIASAPPTAAIAVGFLAYLDSNPCHCGEPVFQSPFNEHLSFFDGRKWYKLRAGLFPGSGDFRLRAYEHRIKLTIKSSSIKVEMTCPHTGEYSWCEIPGEYHGPFDTMAAGFHKACRLNTGEWSCRDDPTCDYTVGVPNGGVARYDNIVLHGGACYTAPGACCKQDTTCSLTPGPCECASAGGEFAGPGTACGEVACCPPQPGDHDLDTDVDQEDFGWFQGCLSGLDIPAATIPCLCGDFDGDGDVDGGDVSAFVGCMRGPDIPADPACAD